MSTSQPTILFVHGAWHSPDLHYSKLQTALTNAGFNVVSPKMPGANRARPPTATLDDDINTIKEEATKLVDQGRPVLVLAHSYGGIVSTSAIPEDLTWTTRQKAGKAGGVIEIVYLCAFLPQTGGGVASLWTGSNATLHFDVLEDGVAFPTNPFDAFYGDVDKGEAQTCADNLHVQPACTFLAGATAEAWKYLPITYIHCTKDGAIPYQLQQSMVAAVQGAGALDIRTEVLEASHSPWLSAHVTPLVGLVKQAWNAYASKYSYAPFA